MKWKVIAGAAALSAAGGCIAQTSSLILFGVLDADISKGTGRGAGSSSRVQVGNSGYNASRIGFRGTEDLGGGMQASFWLESRLMNDTGEGNPSNANNQASGAGTAGNGTRGLTFDRRSTLSVSGRFGEVRMGRDRTADFVARTETDPFLTVGIGTTQTQIGSIAGVTQRFASNMIGYFTPASLGGFYGLAQYHLGENPQDGTAVQDNGDGYHVRAGWKNAELDFSWARGVVKANTGDLETNVASARAQWAGATWMAHIVRDKIRSPVAVHADGWLVGGLYPVGPHLLRAAYSRYGRDSGTKPLSRKVALGYVYNLSRRTAIYGNWAKVSNSGGATTALANAVTAANQSSAGYDIGIRHSF